MNKKEIQSLINNIIKYGDFESKIDSEDHLDYRLGMYGIPKKYNLKTELSKGKIDNIIFNFINYVYGCDVMFNGILISLYYNIKLPKYILCTSFNLNVIQFIIDNLDDKDE